MSDDQKRRIDVRVVDAPRYTMEQMLAIYGNLSRSNPLLALAVDAAARAEKPPSRDLAKIYGFSPQDASTSLTYTGRFLGSSNQAWCSMLRRHLAMRLLP